jgi:hypothetical protein
MIRLWSHLPVIWMHNDSRRSRGASHYRA